MDKEVATGCQHDDGEGKTYYSWCQQCAIKELERGFCEWTSSPHVNKLIQWTQKNMTHWYDHLSFIRYDRLKNIKFYSDGRYGSIYEACWLDGPRWVWNSQKNIWECEKNIKVALKIFKNSSNMSVDFLNQVFNHVKLLTNGSLADFFGITEDPSGNYIFVMKLYTDNLSEYLEKNHELMSWWDIVDMLYSIAEGLDQIHAGGRFHSNLHFGNILIADGASSIDARISDVGLHGPVDEQRSPTDYYGKISFTAPEILRNEKPEETKICKFYQAADIYSFGIIMAMISTGKIPFSDREEDEKLSEDICNKNLHPEIFKESMPQSYYDLMIRCLSSIPEQRPSANELNLLLGKWVSDLGDKPNFSEVASQFHEANDKKWEPTVSMDNIDEKYYLRISEEGETRCLA
ncbi:10037_t:CDS:2 [Acaulospora morrowiae]|uniref:10037_t:CDS:1 n=1 Tax=Acaulospora morrowiae TaxID=94023 RepID=A0A9N9EBD5_9GLOM|nr:10037_t:CDS:2 [Acaulospora morrowiae]